MEKKSLITEVLLRSSVLIVSVDATSPFTIRYISRNVFEVLGYHAEDIQGNEKVWHDIAHSQDQTIFEEMIPFRNTHISFQLRLRRKDGAYCWFSAEFDEMNVESGKQRSLVGTLIDITFWKKAEADNQNRLREFEIKNIILSLSNQAKSVPEILKDLLSPTLDLLCLSGGGIYLINPAERKADLVCHEGISNDFAENRKQVPIDRYPYYKVLVDGELLICNDYSEIDPTLASKHSIGGIVAAPIIVKGIIIGSINLMQIDSGVLSDKQMNDLAIVTKVVGKLLESLHLSEELQESRINFEKFFHSLNDFLFVIDEQGMILKVNQSTVKRLGYSEKELLNMNVLQIHPAERSGEALIVVTEMAKGLTTTCTIPLVTKWGNKIPVETIIAPGVWNRKKALFGISRDRTFQKESEEALQKSELRYRSLVEDQTEFVCRYSPEGLLTYANPAYCRYFNITDVQITDQPYLPIMPPEDRKTVEAMVKSINANDPVKTYQHRVISYDSSIKWIERTDRGIFNTEDQLVEYQSVGRDITSQKDAESCMLKFANSLDELVVKKSAELAESETRYRTIFSEIQEILLILDPRNGFILNSNPAARTFWNLSERDFKTKRLHDLVDIDEDAFLMMVHTAQSDDRPCFEFEKRSTLACSAALEASVGIINLNDQNCMLFVARDITEKRESSRQLLKSQYQLSAIISSLPNAMMVVNNERKVIAWNRNMEYLTGISTKDALGQCYHFCDPLCRLGLPLHFFVSALLDSVSIDTTDTLNLIHRSASSLIVEIHDNGSIQRGKYYSVHVSLLNDEQGKPLGAIEEIRDITEQKNQSKKTALEKKLESIGRLAAGISHEINTPLQYIGDNTMFLKEAYRVLFDPSQHSSTPAELCLPDENAAYYREEVPRAINETLIGIDRINKLMSAMKSFCHPGQGEKTLLNLNQAVRATLTLSQNEWKDVADCQLNLDPDLPLVLCVAEEITQVLINIVVNASDAIKEALKNELHDKGVIQITSKHVDEKVQIVIEDNGIGIPDKIADKIFDPFFTTKEVGKGTGQGLAIAHDIIASHGGEISAFSIPYQQTAFSIVLPIGETSKRA